MPLRCRCNAAAMPLGCRWDALGCPAMPCDALRCRWDALGCPAMPCDALRWGLSCAELAARCPEVALRYSRDGSEIFPELGLVKEPDAAATRVRKEPDAASTRVRGVADGSGTLDALLALIWHTLALIWQTLTLIWQTAPARSTRCSP
eukprot:5998005-Prymnesium_polylepis.2